LDRESYAHNIQAPSQSDSLNMDVCGFILPVICLFTLSQNEILTMFNPLSFSTRGSLFSPPLPFFISVLNSSRR